MKRSKGFTLIELLAVIVILAIIALIATPAILGVIEKTKKGAAESSALGYIDAAEKAMALKMLDDPDFKIPGVEQGAQCFNINADGNIIIGNYNIEVNVKGNQPETGSNICVSENFSIKDGILIFNGYRVTIADGKISNSYNEEISKVIKSLETQIKNSEIVNKEQAIRLKYREAEPSSTEKIYYDKNNSNKLSSKLVCKSNNIDCVDSGIVITSSSIKINHMYLIVDNGKVTSGSITFNLDTNTYRGYSVNIIDGKIGNVILDVVW